MSTAPAAATRRFRTAIMSITMSPATLSSARRSLRRSRAAGVRVECRAHRAARRSWTRRPDPPAETPPRKRDTRYRFGNRPPHKAVRGPPSADRRSIRSGRAQICAISRHDGVRVREKNPKAWSHPRGGVSFDRGPARVATGGSITATGSRRSRTAKRKSAAAFSARCCNSSG